MGPHLMSRPPKFVQGFIDRHGKARFYFRRAGFKAVALPGLPWSPEFMAAYEKALAGQPAQLGSDRVKPGTIRALASSYYQFYRLPFDEADHAIGLQEHYRSVLQGKGQGRAPARRQARGDTASRAHR